MKKHIKKIISLISVMAFLLSASLTVSAQEVTDNNQQEGTVHEVSYTVYDSEGNFKCSGILAPSENPSSRMNYSPVTLSNRDVMYLKNGSSNFLVLDNVRVTMAFGLNRNANVLAHIMENIRNSALNSWSGFTGGLSFSATTYYSVNEVYGMITNVSSDPITVTWASFTF